MKITKIETIQAPEHPHMMWVRVHTDEGIIGTGETTPRVTSANRIIHDICAGMLIGEDPTDIEKHWHNMFQALHYHGYAGSEMRAVSAIDMALWDILGKACGQPIYRLLGGKVRNGIPIYNTCVSHGNYNDRELFMTNPGQLAEDLLKEDITAMKIWPFDELSVATRGHGISAEDMKKGVRIFSEIRSAVGDQMKIAFEGHACWDLPTAIQIARAVEEYEPMWLEDLMPADHIGAMRQLRESTRTPLCVSERLFTRHQFLPVMEQRAADYIMPDICWVGGISEIKKIAVLASAYQLPIAPHNCGGPLQTMAYAHVCSNIENVFILEAVRSFYHTYFHELVDNEPIIRNGKLYVSDEPGLGTALRSEFLRRTDLLVEASETPIESVAWTSGDPWKNDLGNQF